MNIVPVVLPGEVLPVGGSSGATVSDSSGTAVVKGNVADGVVVAVAVDNAQTLANANAKLLSCRNNGSETMAVRLDGHLLLNGGNAGITNNAAAALQVRGGVADGASAVGIKIGNTVALSNATAKIVTFFSDNLATEKLAINATGKLIVPVASSKTAGAAVAGTCALDTNGTVTVATTAVTAASLIFVMRVLDGGTVGGLYTAKTADISAGVSFIIRSFVSSTAGAATAATTDTSTVAWWIIN